MAADGDTGERFCAVFGDIVGSRNVPDRRELQNKVLAGITAINSTFHADLVAPFRIVAGDEVRGLLRDESRSYDLITSFGDIIRPERMRFAVGIGEVSTDLSDDVNVVDGPALHRASAAMAVLKNQKRSRGRTILYSSEDPGRDALLNALTFLVTSIRSRWSDKMWERAALVGSGLTLEDAAQMLGTSHVAVARSVYRSSYFAVDEGEKQISLLLRRLHVQELQCGL